MKSKFCHFYQNKVQKQSSKGVRAGQYKDMKKEKEREEQYSKGITYRNIYHTITGHHTCLEHDKKKTKHKGRK